MVRKNLKISRVLLMGTVTEPFKSKISILWDKIPYSSFKVNRHFARHAEWLKAKPIKEAANDPEVGDMMIPRNTRNTKVFLRSVRRLLVRIFLSP
jgi:hypothetical protein